MISGGTPPDPNLSFSSARRKELKEASTSSKASPYMGRMQFFDKRSGKAERTTRENPLRQSFSIAREACALKGER